MEWRARGAAVFLEFPSMSEIERWVVSAAWKLNKYKWGGSTHRERRVTLWQLLLAHLQPPFLPLQRLQEFAARVEEVLQALGDGVLPALWLILARFWEEKGGCRSPAA